MSRSIRSSSPRRCCSEVLEAFLELSAFPAFLAASFYTVWVAQCYLSSGLSCKTTCFPVACDFGPLPRRCMARSGKIQALFRFGSLLLPCRSSTASDLPWYRSRFCCGRFLWFFRRPTCNLLFEGL